MRRAVGSFVLAAAIATPGIVVAATSSGHGRAVISEYASGELHPIQAQSLDVRLRPAVDAVRRALEANGHGHLTVFPAGDGMAQIVDLNSPQHCVTVVTFDLTVHPSNELMLLDPACDSGSIRHGRLYVTYSPPSLSFVVREALATLPGGNAG